MCAREPILPLDVFPQPLFKFSPAQTRLTSHDSCQENLQPNQFGSDNCVLTHAIPPLWVYKLKHPHKGRLQRERDKPLITGLLNNECRSICREAQWWSRRGRSNGCGGRCSLSSKQMLDEERAESEERITRAWAEWLVEIWAEMTAEIANSMRNCRVRNGRGEAAHCQVLPAQEQGPGLTCLATRQRIAARREKSAHPKGHS